MPGLQRDHREMLPTSCESVWGWGWAGKATFGTLGLFWSLERFNVDCNCIVTRGGAYDELLPEPEGNPEGRA